MPPQGRESIPQPLSLPRGTQGIKLPLHAVLFKKKRQATDFIVQHPGKNCTPPHNNHAE